MSNLKTHDKRRIQYIDIILEPLIYRIFFYILPSQIHSQSVIY